MPKSPSAKTSAPKAKLARSYDAEGSRIVIPVLPAHDDGDPLLSRAQAKRVLAGAKQFRTVVFDFSGVSSIGQAFADEIFRVFAHTHPRVRLQFSHATAPIQQMISRARSAAVRQSPLKDAAPPASPARTRD